MNYERRHIPKNTPNLSDEIEAAKADGWEPYGFGGKHVSLRRSFEPNATAAGLREAEALGFDAHRYSQDHPDERITAGFMKRVSESPDEFVSYL